jgi:penicillin-binding protein-related factor A (putative recombinase)
MNKRPTVVKFLGQNTKKLTRFPFSNVHEHQMEYLAKYHLLLHSSEFFLVYLGSGRWRSCISLIN